MSKLNTTSRDELLIRLDERVRDIREDSLPAIEKHLETLNGHLDDHSHRITTVEAQLGERSEPKKLKKKVVAGYGTGGLSFVTMAVFSIGKWQGWW